jgi:hypothetical protein
MNRRCGRVQALCGPGRQATLHRTKVRLAQALSRATVSVVENWSGEDRLQLRSSAAVLW